MTPWYTLPETSSSRLKRWRPKNSPPKKCMIFTTPFFPGIYWLFFLFMGGKHVTYLLSLGGCSQILVASGPCFRTLRHEDSGSEKSSEKSVSAESDSSESGMFVSRCGKGWFLRWRIKDVCFTRNHFKQGDKVQRFKNLSYNFIVFFGKMVMFKNGVWWYLFCLGLWLFTVIVLGKMRFGGLENITVVSLAP